MKSMIYFLLFLQWHMVFSRSLDRMDDLSNLGARIEQQVWQALLPVTANADYLSYLGADIERQVQQSLLPVTANADYLSNLGADIERQVQQGLLPVTAMTIKLDMINGIGGVTVVEDKNSQPSFIVKDKIKYVCDGVIQGSNCNGSLHKFEISTRQDLCYANSYTVSNNNICLSAGSPTMNIINNIIVSCNSFNGAPTILLSKQEYHELCGSKMPWERKYTYYSNPARRDSIKIPNENHYVTCDNNEPNICEFETEFENMGGSIHITNSYNNNIRT